MAAKKGKHLVTREQTAAILKELESRRQSMPSGGMTMKQQLSAKKKRETANGKILTAEFKGRQPAKKTKAQQEAEDLAAIARKQGKKGHTYDDLSPDQGKGQQAMRSTARADIQSAEMGKPRKKDESWLVDTLNFIGRPMFATAEAANDNQEKYYRERHKGKSKKKALWEGFKAGFGGWGEGISGKKKTTFSDVIQESANNRKANRLGVGAERDDEVGPAKVNPFLKHGVGLTLDILGDPLTYVGVGAVTKAAQAGKILKGEEVAQNLVKNIDTYKKIESAGSGITRKQLQEITGVARAPVEQIKRLDKKTQAILNSNPEAKALYEAVRLDRKTGPKFKRMGAAETKHFGSRVEVGPVPSTVADLMGIKNKTMRTVAESTVERELKAFPGLSNSLKEIGFKGDLMHLGVANQAKGTVHLSTDWATQKKVKDAWAFERGYKGPHGGTWSAVPVKTQKAFLERTIIHEVGHHAGYLLPKATRDALQKGIKEEAASLGVSVREFLSRELGDMAATREGSRAFEETLAEGWVAYRMLGDKASNTAKAIGKAMEEVVSKAPVAPVREAKHAFDEVGAQTFAAWAKTKGDELTAAGVVTSKELNKTVREQAKKAGMLPEQIAADLLAATTRNLSPTIQKQLRVRVGTKNVGVAGTENIGKVFAKMNSVSVVNKATKTFNETFRAMAKVNPTLGMLRNQGLGQSSNRVAALLTQHERTWNVLPLADRKAIWKDWRSPTPNGSVLPAGVDNLGNPIPNAVKYVDDQVRMLQDSVDQLGITPNEIGAWLNDPKIRLDATTVPGWKIGPTGAQARIPGDASQDWLVNFLRHNDSIDDPGRTLFALHAALEHSIAKRSVNQSAAQHFGVPVAVANAPKEALHAAKDLKAQGYREVNLPGTEGMLFHPDIAEGLVKMNAIMNDRMTMDKWLRGLDQATLVFKGAVTRYNPSFHVRTLGSEFMLSFIGGMRNPGWAYPKAAQVLRGRGTEYLGETAGLAAKFDGDRQMVMAGNAKASQQALTRTAGEGAKVVFQHPTYGRLTADQVWGLFRNSGLKTGFATTDVQRSMNPTRSQNMLSKLNGSAQRGFENVEDFGRLAHFMDILKHSKFKTLDEAVADAAETVLKYHLDYTAVTQFEKSWMNRAMPFYKWVRLSTPMILESMAHNPGKALMAPKALSNMSEAAGYDVNGFGIAPGGADALTPGFLREAGALPLFNAFGDNQYFNPAQTVPMYGLLNESNQNPMNKINPFFKVPTELALNKSAMGPPPRDEGNLKRYLLGQTPQTNLGQVIATGTDETDVDKRQRLLSFLLNPGFQPATPRRVEGEAQMEWDRASKHRRAVKKQLGIDE